MRVGVGRLPEHEPRDLEPERDRVRVRHREPWLPRRVVTHERQPPVAEIDRSQNLLPRSCHAKQLQAIQGDTNWDSKPRDHCRYANGLW